MFSTYLSNEIENLFQHGEYNELLRLLTLYLIFSCGAISLYCFVIESSYYAKQQQALQIKNTCMLDNYHILENGMNQYLSLQQHISTQINAMYLFFKTGDYEQLGEYLKLLQTEQEALTLPSFTNNTSMNTLLSYYAYLAEQYKIAFHVKAQIPVEASIMNTDLCILIMNMLNNAFEANDTVSKDQKRYVDICFEYRDNNSLYICCENMYTGTLEQDELGMLLSTKTDKAGIGLGLHQMKLICDRYDAKLDLNWSNNVFILQTTLTLTKCS